MAVAVVAAAGLVLGVLCQPSSAFPNGAPIEACILPHANSPNHAGTKPQPHHTAKHSIIASSGTYTPGDIIRVTISGPDPFKGYFVQAQDRHTGDWLGEWVHSPASKMHPECSAITHADNSRKKRVEMAWRAPHEGSGSVIFTGTVLESYDKYWSDMVAKIARPRRPF